MDTFTLYDYKILSTGVDGGHRYLTADITYEGLTRKLVVFFENKADENSLNENAIIHVKGNLLNQGLQQSLILNDSILTHQQKREDKELIQLLHTRDGIATEILLKNGEKKKVWNIAEGYDLGEAYANLTTNCSPSIEGTPIEIINTSEISQIIDPSTKEVLLDSSVGMV